MGLVEDREAAAAERAREHEEQRALLESMRGDLIAEFAAENGLDPADCEMEIGDSGAGPYCVVRVRRGVRAPGDG